MKRERRREGGMKRERLRGGCPKGPGRRLDAAAAIKGVTRTGHRRFHGWSRRGRVEEGAGTWLGRRCRWWRGRRCG